MKPPRTIKALLAAALLLIAAPLFAAEVVPTGSNQQAVKITDASGNAVYPGNNTLQAIEVDIKGTGGVAQPVDGSAFTAGTTPGIVTMFELDDAATTVCAEDKACAGRLTPQRGQHVNLRNQAGTEIGTAGAPVRVDPTGTTKQGVTGADGDVFVRQATAANLNAQVQGAAATNAAVAGNPVYVGGQAMTDGTPPTANTGGNAAPLLTDRYGRLLVSQDHPKRFNCSVVNNAATSLTAFGSPCAAPGAGLSLYITDVTASSSVIATTTADQYLEIKSGTGGTCGTGTAVVWAAYNLAFAPITANFIVPIKVAANSELCWMHAATGSKTFIVQGYIAP